MTNGFPDTNAGNGEARARRRQEAIELAVFLFLIVPSMVISLFLIKQGRVSFVLAAFSIMLRDLALISLILYFLWRNREAPGRIGWQAGSAAKEALLGIWLFIPFFFGTGLLEGLLHKAGFSAPAARLPALTPGKNVFEFFLASVLVIVVAVAEETIFRGYLILRFRNITASAGAAVLASAVIFSLGHGYEGSAGVLTVGMMGVVFSVVYLWRQSIVAPVVMHFLQDFIGIVLIPLLGIH